ncbi:MAG: DUF4278 domain-containing protein [Cyanobacteria bacterium P01_A01_bin.114]
MKLTYRGVSYDYTPPAVATKSTGKTGKYRGVDVRFRAVEHPPVQPLKVDMIYRGVRYGAGEAAEAAESGVPVAQSVSERLRGLVMGHARNVRRREQSMLARMDEQVGLTAKDAAHYASRIQGKTSHGFGGYDRSGAAMS